RAPPPLNCLPSLPGPCSTPAAEQIPGPSRLQPQEQTGTPASPPRWRKGGKDPSASGQSANKRLPSPGGCPQGLPIPTATAPRSAAVAPVAPGRLLTQRELPSPDVAPMPGSAAGWRNSRKPPAEQTPPRQTAQGEKCACRRRSTAA